MGLKRGISALLCALVCFTNTKSNALPSAVKYAGILGEFVGLSILEAYFIIDAERKGSFSKYHCFAVTNPIFLVWDLYGRITSQSNDILKSVEDSGKGKTNSKKV